MRRVLLLVPVLIVLGCTDKERLPVMGQWTGGFYTDEAEVLRGYLQLYRGKDQFKMRLGSKHQEIDFTGTWTVANNRIELRASDIKFTNPSEEKIRTLGLEILKADTVRDNYRKPIVLTIGEGNKSLTGLTMTVGKFQGRHKFNKGQASGNAQRVLDDLAK